MCRCSENFGQHIWAPQCDTHTRCPVVMRGIPIQCILVKDHGGDHK